MAPMPKRSDQRRRRNIALPVEKAPTGPAVEPPELRAGIHPLAVSWYASLASSGQARYYEPSDWMTAQLLAESIDSYTREPSAAMLSAILAGTARLLATEGDRRRMRLELIRAQTPGLSRPPSTTSTTSTTPARARLRAIDTMAVDDGAAG